MLFTGTTNSDMEVLEPPTAFSPAPLSNVAALKSTRLPPQIGFLVDPITLVPFTCTKDSDIKAVEPPTALSLATLSNVAAEGMSYSPGQCLTILMPFTGTKNSDMEVPEPSTAHSLTKRRRNRKTAIGKVLCVLPIRQ